MKLAIILGTRPEIIKMAPVIWECQRRKIDFFILHTGQHYTPVMDELFFAEFKLPQPKYNLGLGGLSHREQIGHFIKNITSVLRVEKPDVVIVQGDTTSVVAGALAANKLGITIAHHEAGLRSYDVTMLEEINRTFTDHISEYLFTPTKTAIANLIEEGFDKDSIFFTGNTIVDVIHKYRRMSRPALFKKLGVKPQHYFLFTAHRQENVDNSDRLKKILAGLRLLTQKYPKLPIVWPLHPRTKKRIEEAKFKIPKEIRVIDPVGYFDMLSLERQARLIITDSGGVQEEACILQVATVTIRDNTERPETVTHGFNVLVPGVEPQDIVDKVAMMLNKEFVWFNPFGDGTAGKKIVDCLLKSKA